MSMLDPSNACLPCRLSPAWSSACCRWLLLGAAQLCTLFHVGFASFHCCLTPPLHMQVDPARRISAGEALKHPFFNEHEGGCANGD
jgi:hypothetical protein